MLRAAYWKAGQPAPDLKLVEKPIPAKHFYPKIEVTAPGFRQEVGAALNMAAQFGGEIASVDGGTAGAGGAAGTRGAARGVGNHGGHGDTGDF